MTPDEESLKQTELRWNTAIEQNLVGQMAAYMHDEWIIFSGDGNITTKESFLQFIVSGDLVHTKMDFEILQVNIFESTGLVMQRGTSAGTWKGLPFENYEIASSVFIRSNEGWKAVQTMIAPVPRPL